MKVLVLNADFTPFDVWSWHKAMRKLLSQKREDVTIYPVKNYDKIVRDGSGNEYDVPAVVALKEFIPVHNKPAPYGKANIYARDLNVCQYCGDVTSHHNRTIDHVIPRAHWNHRRYHFKLSSFENVVTCCRSCNTEKRNRTPQQAGMLLKRKPRRISRVAAYRNKLILYGIKDEWLEFITPGKEHDNEEEKKRD